MKEQLITIYKYFGESSIKNVICSMFDLPIVLNEMSLQFDEVHGRTFFKSKHPITGQESTVVYVKDAA